MLPSLSLYHLLNPDHLLQGTVSKLNQRDICSLERETLNEWAGNENVGFCDYGSLHLALFCWAYTNSFFSYFAQSPTAFVFTAAMVHQLMAYHGWLDIPYVWLLVDLSGGKTTLLKEEVVRNPDMRSHNFVLCLKQ